MQEKCFFPAHLKQGRKVVYDAENDDDDVIWTN